MKTTLTGDNENKGGFLGLGSTTVAVPWTAFQISKEGDKTKYVLDATKERLEKRLRWKGKTTNGFTPGKLLSPFHLLARNVARRTVKTRNLMADKIAAFALMCWRTGRPWRL